ncbi:MAG: flagellar biosynthetic protein FliR [Polyangia bacterium]
MTGLDAAWVAAARAAPIAILAPPLGGRSASAKVVLAGVLAAVVWPAVRQAEVSGPFALTLGREALVGLALGLVAAVPFRAAEAAGILVDRARAPGGRGRHVLGDAYALLALALFAALDGPRLVISGLAESYAAFPVGSAVQAAGGARVILEAGAHLVEAAIALAAPVLAALLLAELVAGVAVRAQPALEQAIGFASVRTLVAIAVVGLGAATGMRALLGPLAGGGGLTRALAEAARSLAGP